MVLRLVSRLARVGTAIVERLGGPKIGCGLPVGVVPPAFEIEAWLNTSNGELTELDSLRGQPVFSVAGVGPPAQLNLDRYVGQAISLQGGMKSARAQDLA